MAEPGNHWPLAAVVGHQRPNMLVENGGQVTNSGGGDSVDKFWMRRKMVLQKMKE